MQKSADLIDVLRGHLASFEWPQGTPEEARAYFRLMDATSTTLGGLLRSHAARERHDGVYDLLVLLQSFMEGSRATEHLEAMRGDPGFYKALIDPLIALHRQIQKERSETMPRPRRSQSDHSGEGGTVTAEGES